MSVLVDSDILIDVSRGREPETSTQWAALARAPEVVLCTPITVAELWRGAREDEHAILRELFEALVCVAIDREIGRRAGDYLRQYAKSHGLELADALIAAAASMHNAHLWTGNLKHYPMKDVLFYRP